MNQDNIFERGLIFIIEVFFPPILFILLAGMGIGLTLGCGYVILDIITPDGPPTPYSFEYPQPLDVCPGTKVNATMRDAVITVDYVNLRGDTVYLIYDAWRGSSATFKSQEVLNGDDCPS